MGIFGSPLQFASVATALVWPLGAGVAIVVWSKVRAAAHARRVAAMEAELQDLYQTMEARPVPQRLAMVVDALEEGEELTPSETARTDGRKATTAKS
jgi:hypothetical protein